VRIFDGLSDSHDLTHAYVNSKIAVSGHYGSYWEVGRYLLVTRQLPSLYSLATKNTILGCRSFRRNGGYGVGSERDADKLISTAKALLQRGGALETSRGGEPLSDQSLVRAIQVVLPEVIDRPEQPERNAQAAAEKVVSDMRSAFDDIKRGAPPTGLSERQLSCLELIVRTVGRPAMRYKNGKVETPPNELGDNARWYALVITDRDRINNVSGSIGRIGSSSYPVIGTGWLIGPTHVVTNKHVACELVKDRTRPPETWQIDPAKSGFIDFAYTDGSPSPAQFDIEKLVCCASTVDLAILQIHAANATLPKPIIIDWKESSLGRKLYSSEEEKERFQGDEIYTVGHPYRPGSTQPILDVFGQADGRKRCSPGVITQVDKQKPEFQHDCSTLGGNSGSCVVSFSNHAAVGLHFGGHAAAGSAALGIGTTNYAIAFARLPNDNAIRVLKNPR
jgi:hypothetical protein